MSAVGLDAEGPVYDSAHSYARYPTEELPVPVDPSAHSYDGQYYSYYHLSVAPLYTPGTTYDRQLAIDDQSQMARTPAQYPTGDYYPQVPSQGYFSSAMPPAGYNRPQTPTEGYNAQNITPHSPTTQRWSSEFSSAERLRLGRPRYETEQELEEQRQAYEDASHQADDHEPAQQN